jgi:hypothetical protein
MSCVFVSIQLCDIIVFDCAEVGFHCVSSDGYIASFDLLWISIVFCVKHGYIVSFELNWICIVFCQVDGFIEYFNRNNRTRMVFNCLSDV